jgi:multiple RNA-binding domain-containing protein 1
VDGHAWQLKVSDRPSAAPTAARRADAGAVAAPDDDETKLVVRNVPFEATVKELRALFQCVCPWPSLHRASPDARCVCLCVCACRWDRAFGQLKSLRLPKKFDGSHRGFAFVEFLTHQEAENGTTPYPLAPYCARGG